MSNRCLMDLHTHSTASDGSDSPAAVVDLAEKRNLAAVALTDHDTVAGLAEAAERARLYPELAFIPGIEISAAFPNGVLHILGLGIDQQAESLTSIAEKLRQARELRNPQIVEKLQQHGVNITMDDVLEVMRGDSKSSRRVVSRVHIAEAIRRTGAVKTIGEAFDKFIGQDGCAYVDKDFFKPSHAIAAILDADGVAVLAHPRQLNYDNSAQLERIIREFMDAGLGGVECYHSTHTPQDTRLYLDLAKKFNLAITGGSDYHGQGKAGVELGLPRTPVSQLRQDLAEKWLKG